LKNYTQSSKLHPIRSNTKSIELQQKNILYCENIKSRETPEEV
jgi:hypothetical protein